VLENSDGEFCTQQVRGEREREKERDDLGSLVVFKK